MPVTRSKAGRSPQLAAASIERRPDLNAAVASLSARQGDIERYFLESLFAQLPQPLTDFLTRVAILDTMVPDRCDAVTGGTSAPAMLEQLGQDTPIMIVAEGRDWMRLHPLARDFLLGRFERLPTAERHELHSRAARWLADRQFFHEAALHAFATGDRALAQTHAERCLWALVNMGKLGEAREWLDRFPEEAIARDVRLQLVGVTMALGDRPHRQPNSLAMTPAIRRRRVISTKPPRCLPARLHAPRSGAIPAFWPWESFPAPAGNPTLAIANTNACIWR
jgi:LuxR family maltose regulon positive regulatory protein